MSSDSASEDSGLVTYLLLSLLPAAQYLIKDTREKIEQEKLFFYT